MDNPPPASVTIHTIPRPGFSPRRAASDTAVLAMRSPPSRPRGFTKSGLSPANTSPVRVPRNLLTTFSYFALSTPLVASRRIRGKTHHVGWDYRSEFITGFLKFSLGSPDFQQWRRLTGMGATFGRIISRDLRIRRVKETFVDGYWISLNSATKRAALKAKPYMTIFYLHGGGYTTGEPLMHSGAFQKLLTYLSRDHGLHNVRFFAVKYPLAPEHPYPAAINTAFDAYHWLTVLKGVDPSTVVVSGDSAGGGLALSLLQMIRNASPSKGLSLPKASLLISPWLELLKEIPSHATKEITRKDYLSPRCTRPFVEAYLGNSGASLVDPLVSPLYMDFKDIPPIMITCGGVELFRDSITSYYEKARDAGIDVFLEVDMDMPHVYPMLVDFYGAKSRNALRKMAEWLSEIWEGDIISSPSSTPEPKVLPKGAKTCASPEDMWEDADEYFPGEAPTKTASAPPLQEKTSLP
ncbi:alpha/beta hydrolase fold-domain-containing protein [Piptocephalis cylindrospora]|uniref:Alpha/beta hydrolase fold-domain-containing protein n=1 Tax=Piptocephalis cylindrospora TaxID=1907219 RepID=A0A4P9YA71_9FUNG|nr:alpha/beta hydrolase fold-domain-containing protein [Piptocephalis cylindrospora]|eukprot:RKP15361.1 alpha/beta hydrolase fold-domain-containing protein [Piptocephalis cylindrospora]